MFAYFDNAISFYLKDVINNAPNWLTIRSNEGTKLLLSISVLTPPIKKKCSISKK